MLSGREETAGPATGKYKTLEKKISPCVEACWKLLHLMRSSKAHWTLVFRKAERFNFNLDHLAIESITISGDALKNLKVSHCLQPALVKYGTDYGQDYTKRTVLSRAEVFVEAQNLRKETVAETALEVYEKKPGSSDPQLHRSQGGGETHHERNENSSNTEGGSTEEGKNRFLSMFGLSRS